MSALARAALLTLTFGMFVLLSRMPLEGLLAAPAPPPLWSTLRGRIVWKAAAGESAIPEGIIIDPKTNGVRWVIVWLEPEPDSRVKALPVHPSRSEVRPKEVLLEMSGNEYVPHALAIREGQVLRIQNRDKAAHACQWSAEGRNRELVSTRILPPGGPAIEMKGFRADPIPLMCRCPIHPRMKAVARVFDHPCSAVTDASGRFEIPLAPAGRWRLKAWQEDHGYRGGAAGRKGYPVVVQRQEVTDLGDLPLNP
jgi:hypothetical protein